MVGWLVGWLVGWSRIVPIIYIFITIYHACVHFLSKIYTPILPQSGVIVKRKIFRGFGRIFGCDYLSAFACRILSESVGIFSRVSSSICIAYISILCYYYLTDSVCMPWQVRYFFKVRVCCRASITLRKVRINCDRK